MRATFKVYGDPIAQPRHRIAKSGGRYIPKDHSVHSWKTKLAIAAKRLVAEEKFKCVPKPEPIWLELYFKMPRPKSTSKNIHCHTKKPDVDNLAKTIQDAFEGILYENDSQICRLIVYKDYEPSGCPQSHLSIVIATGKE